MNLPISKQSTNQKSANSSIKHDKKPSNLISSNLTSQSKNFKKPQQQSSNPINKAALELVDKISDDRLKDPSRNCVHPGHKCRRQ